MRSQPLLDEFVAYCRAHPDERFWQAVRNWSGFGHIYAATYADDDVVYHDTFYWETKDAGRLTC